MAVAGDLGNEVSRIAGVRSAQCEFVEEVIDRFGALRPYLERHLAATAMPPGRPGLSGRT